MNSFAASAPGKVVLAGDYAVLEGAPALVMALNRRAQVQVHVDAGDSVRVEAPDIGVALAHGRWLDGHLQWLDVDSAVERRLRLVAAVIEQAATADRAFTGRVRLDTAAFFAANGGDKLGLGSSAAVTVALAAALAQASGTAMPPLETLLALHRGPQAGRGSGIDLAASLHGGVLLYARAQGRARVSARRWPAGLFWRLIWTGRGASTAAALTQLGHWRRSHAARHGRLMTRLGDTATELAIAFGAGHVQDVVEGLGVYAGQLDELGSASGIDIVSAEHRRIGALAATCKVAYKPCGAGGGDVGIVVATDPERLAACSERIKNIGFGVARADIDPQGMRHEPTETCNRRTT